MTLHRWTGELKGTPVWPGATGGALESVSSTCYGKPLEMVQAGCPSGQWEQTVNLSVNAYGGSNPSPATYRVRECRRQARLDIVLIQRPK